jgi:hypothetical protein
MAARSGKVSQLTHRTRFATGTGSPPHAIAHRMPASHAPHRTRHHLLPHAQTAICVQIMYTMEHRTGPVRFNVPSCTYDLSLVDQDGGVLNGESETISTSACDLSDLSGMPLMAWARRNRASQVPRFPWVSVRFEARTGPMWRWAGPSRPAATSVRSAAEEPRRRVPDSADREPVRAGGRSDAGAGRGGIRCRPAGGPRPAGPSPDPTHPGLPRRPCLAGPRA